MTGKSQAIDSNKAKPADAVKAGAFIALRTMQARPCFAATMQRVSILHLKQMRGAAGCLGDNDLQVDFSTQEASI